jgi:hypothetical protein
MTGTTPGDAEQRRRQPVFILAPARSFSTVTTALLAGHPSVYGFPEMLLFTASTVGELLDSGRYAANRSPGYVNALFSGVYRTVAAVHEEDQSDPAIRRAVAWLGQRPSWTTKQLMDHLLELVAPRAGLEKSPGTISSDESLAACLRAYPQARYIHLTRHPVDTQRSMQKNYRQTLARPLGDTVVAARCASAWYLGHRRVMRVLAGLPPEQWFRVRAEDLLHEPPAWLPRILGWLGLACDDEIISRMLRTEAWQFSGTGPSRRLFGGDAKFFAAPALRPVAAPGPVCFDPDWGLTREMCRRMTILAHDLGYR